MARPWCRAAAAAVASVIAVSAQAQTLGKEACDTAEVERAKLVADGVQDVLKRGPAWAKSNLPPHKIRDIERYIALQEVLLFKCGQAKLRHLPSGDGEDAGDAPAATKDGSAADVAEKPAPSKEKPRKPPPAKAQAKQTTADRAPGPKAATKHPRSKPKVDDAFRPPKAIAQPPTE